jgi:hypothetical protein
MTEQERREQRKERLEYVKSIIQFIGLGTVLFAASQWYISNKNLDIANKNALLGTYQAITSRWSDHLKLIFENHGLRPYFEEGKDLRESDNLRNEILAYADLRLDVMDAIYTLLRLHGSSESEILGWIHTFESAFRNSPVLCERLNETKQSYGYIVPVGNRSCRVAR